METKKTSSIKFTFFLLQKFERSFLVSFNFAKGISFPYTLTAIEISGKFDRCLRNLARLGQTPRDLSAEGKFPFSDRREREGEGRSKPPRRIHLYGNGRPGV